MDSNSRITLRTTIEDFLRTEHPERLHEFQIVFDDVCDVLANASIDLLKDDSPPSKSGINFDASSIADPVISLSMVVGAMFAQAATEAVTNNDLIIVFDRLETKLNSLFGHPELVGQLRQKTQKVLEDT